MRVRVRATGPSIVAHNDSLPLVSGACLDGREILSFGVLEAALLLALDAVAANWCWLFGRGDAVWVGVRFTCPLSGELSVLA